MVRSDAGAGSASSGMVSADATGGAAASGADVASTFAVDGAVLGFDDGAGASADAGALSFFFNSGIKYAQRACAALRAVSCTSSRV